MTTDAELDAIERRLRTYVLETLASPDGSPALGEFEVVLKATIKEELGPTIADAQDALGEFRQAGRLNARLNGIEKELGNVERRLKRIDHMLEGLARANGVDLTSMQQAPRKRGGLWLLPVVLILIVIVGFAVMSLAPQLRAPQPTRPDTAAQATIPAERETIVDRGWQRVITLGDFRADLCGSDPSCHFADRLRARDFNRDRALQAAIEALRQDFSCRADPLDVDGQIGPSSVAAFRTVVNECVALSEDPRCSEAPCDSPPGFGDGSPSVWTEGLLNWALTILGASP